MARGILFPALLLLMLCTTASCTDEAAVGPVRSAEDDSVFALVRAVDAAAFREAFVRLEGSAFTHTLRTEQFAGDGRRLALEDRVIRYDLENGASTARLLDRRMTGSFEFGFFSRFAADARTPPAPADLGLHMLAEDPAYTSPRSRDAFVYRQLPDTTLWGRSVRVLDVEARPGEGDGQAIRSARLYVLPGTNTLVAVHLERAERGLLFEEESRLFSMLQPSASGVWLPYRNRFDTRLDVPLRPPQHFRLVSDFHGYDRFETGL